MFYGLDVHKEFIQICCLGKEGQVIKEYRIRATVNEIEEYTEQLQPGDEVVLESTFHTWAIYTILCGGEAKVVVANSLQVKAIANARIKTDRIDARVLAQLLRTGFIPEVKMPDEKTWEMRQLSSYRRFLTKQKVMTKANIRSILHKKLIDCPWRDLETAAAKEWLRAQSFTDNERLLLECNIEQMETLVRNIKKLDNVLGSIAANELQIRLLMTIPGVDVTAATGMFAAIGEIGRFHSPDKLASYFGLVPSVYQSANNLYTGHITKMGASGARHLAIEAAQKMVLSPSPANATYYRIRKKKGHNVAVTAMARKLVTLCWHILSNKEPYRYATVQNTRKKLRRVMPDRKTARPGCKPKTIEEVYAETGLPPLREPSDGESRSRKDNELLVRTEKHALGYKQGIPV